MTYDHSPQSGIQALKKQETCGLSPALWRSSVTGNSCSFARVGETEMDSAWQHFIKKAYLTRQLP